MLKRYFKNIFDVARQGDATEQSYYSTLETLLKEYRDSINKKGIAVTTIPKQTEGGNPDFRVWDGKQHVVGYIEAKAPTVEDLGKIEETEQLKRYLKTFPNLILTNFCEFRLYRDGQLKDKVAIGRPYVLNKLRTVPPVEKEKEFYALLEQFFLFSLPKVTTAKGLATELAKRTSFLRDEVIAQELAEEEKTKRGHIHGFYEAFRKYLISGLTQRDFADLYSQTVTYGLFAARTRTEKEFNRRLAYANIPRTIGILREVFRFISLEDLPGQMEWIIDDISEVLAVTDVGKILHQYYREHKGSDPIVHFYETFLSVYDPEAREKRGVYYTPEPVVSYIVRSLNLILKEKFDRPEGFANEAVTVLDPAAGTLTFIAEAAKLAVEEFVSRYGEGKKKDFIRTHILNKNKEGNDVLSNNFYAFELMMAPYAIGHIKMSFLLEELGYKLQPDDRFMLFLTNTLEMEELEQTDLPGMAALSEESHYAGKVKKEKPILVILGNPPYSGHSANKSEIKTEVKEGEQYITHYMIKDGKWTPHFKKADKDKKVKYKTWIGQLIEDYKLCDGEPLGEKNPKWLNDDYVKFIRFAQWKIEEEGEGVLGFITNHSYLDNPTFRGMRQSLMNTFNEIYILDLHGNSLKKERCPDGSVDKNVFDIMQGVAIALFIKQKGVKGCTVRNADLFGQREKKYTWLFNNDKNRTAWKKLDPKSEFYLFIPRDDKLAATYEQSVKVTEIFPVNSVGIVTARDKLTIKSSEKEVWNTVLNFLKLDPETAREHYGLGKDARDWQVAFAQNDLKESGPSKENIVTILYRPFDKRYTYYTGKSRGFLCMPRPEVMRHMLHENLGLCFMRQVSLDESYTHILATDSIVDNRTFLSSKGIIQIAPLYLYPDTDKKDLLSHAESGERKPNISPKFFDAVKKAYGRKPSPEDIFNYIYAVLYAPTYREKYAEFLKIDFPRVPFTKDKNLFQEMGKFGKELVALHLMKSKALERPIARFEGEGDDKVEKLKYDPGQNRLYINKEQYFDDVSPDVHDYQIGGYQVAEKWLKDRKGRTLTLDDIRHYCKVVTALKHTIELQEKIDAIYPAVEKEIIAF